MIGNIKEWLVAALPIVIPAIGAIFVAITAANLVYQNRHKRSKQALAQRLEPVTKLVRDSIEFHSTHYAYVAAEAFTEDEVVDKLSKLVFTRQEAALQAAQIDDPGLNHALGDFLQAYSRMSSQAGKHPHPDSAAFQTQMSQLRAAGEKVHRQIALLRR